MQYIIENFAIRFSISVAAAVDFQRQRFWPVVVALNRREPSGRYSGFGNNAFGVVVGNAESIKRHALNNAFKAMKNGRVLERIVSRSQ
ncbi:MAG TPA: hypothetical protein VFI31_01590 [Pirellulales bacterium]|nr:hypothetical protein [Pirellulales bacterium]